MSDAKVDSVVLEIFADAIYLRMHFPFDYRESSYYVDPSTGVSSSHAVKSSCAYLADLIDYKCLAA